MKLGAGAVEEGVVIAAGHAAGAGDVVEGFEYAAVYAKYASNRSRKVCFH